MRAGTHGVSRGLVEGSLGEGGPTWRATGSRGDGELERYFNTTSCEFDK